MHINNLQDIYYLLTLMSSAVILTLSVLLAKMNIPDIKGNSLSQNSRHFLCLSYLILGLSSMASCGMDYDLGSPFELLFSTAAVASFQSLLFTCTHLVFIKPKAFNEGTLKYNILAILLVILLILVLYIKQIVPNLYLYGTILITYLLQQTYYTLVFRKQYHRFIQQMKADDNREQNRRLHYIGFSFYAALTIGLLSIISSCSGLMVYVLFIVTYTLYYLFFFLFLYQSQLSPAKTFGKAINHTKVSKHKHEDDNSLHSFEKGNNTAERDEAFHRQLSDWVATKGFLQKDLTVDDMADLLGTDRDYLRYYFRTYVHTDFRTWRSELRIQESKELLREHPEYSLTKISEMVGFNHRANFFSQFIKTVGISPTLWREKYNEKQS